MFKLSQKVIATLLISILLITQFNFIAFLNPVSAATNGNFESNVKVENEHYKYYYDQLSEQAKKIYDAIYEMYTSGNLRTGNANLDLVTKGIVSQEMVEAYRKGDNTLIIAVENARDAFYLDYPELFYINMEKFSIRITSGKDGYHVWLGTGSNDSYYLQGFSNETEVLSAEKAYNDKINEIISEAKKIKAGENENLIEKQIEYIHEQVIKNTTYKLDNVCKPENAGHIRTPYGALVAGESVCEGYSKAMKVLLDKLGIPCILVRGIYTHEGSRVEAHMWNYVKLDGKWYAIDSTFDDDDEENVYTRYLLAGDYLMSQGHTTDGIMSAPEFEFKYPKLEDDNYGVKEIASSDGLIVKYETTEGASNYTASTYHISYKGMGFAEAEKAGYHFIVKFYQKDKNGKLLTQDWCYILNDRDYFPSGMIKDSKEEFEITLYYMSYVEIAVTNVKYGPYRDTKNYTDKERLRFLWYLSDNDHMVAYSGLLDCPDADKYKPAPKITSASPYISSKLKPGKATHIRLVYDEELELAEGYEKNNVNIKVVTNAWTSSATDNSKVENIKFSENKVEFDFTPSTQWGDNSTIYYLNIEGLIGSSSKRTPSPAYYYVQESFGCTYSMKSSGVWRAYARPTLIESSDLSTNNWTLSDGTTVSGNLSDRLALVTTKVSTEDTNTMNNLIEKGSSNKVLKSETYNIDLTLCGKTTVTNGHKLTVYLGFPEGYGPNDAGVTFKAYHFIYKYGEIAEVEEIPCVITPYGLLVTCSSFSPFAVTAVEKPESSSENTNKSIVITADEHGKIPEIDSSIVELKAGESRNYTIQANEGYSIDSLTLFGKEVEEAIGKDSYEITVNYNDIKDSNNIVNATFVAKTVAKEEAERGEKVVTVEIEPAKITDMPMELIANVGEKTVIKPTITPSNGIDTYQWYKDKEELKGQTKSELVFDPVKIEDEGIYTLVITSTLDSLSERTMSTSCKILTSDFEVSLEATKKEVMPGEILEVNAYLKNLRNIKEGIVAFTGQFEFDSNLLEIYKVEGKEALVGEDGWDLSAFNDENFVFIADNDKHITENSHMFTIYFKAKENITTETETEIKLKNVSASEGNGVILPVSDASETIKIFIEEEKEYFTSKVYKINEETNIITQIPQATTVTDFRNSVDTNQSIIFVDPKGQVLADTDIIPTGTKITAGTEFKFTLIVAGDIDCDGKCGVNDLALIKLHFIGKEKLEGYHLMAADIDGTESISINDIAQIKLSIIK